MRKAYGEARLPKHYYDLDGLNKNSMHDRYLFEQIK